MADMASGQVAVAAAQAPVIKWEVTRAHSKAGTYMRHWLPSEDELLFEVVAKNMGPLPAKPEPVDEDKPLDKKSNNPDGPSVHLQMKAVSWKPVAAAMAHLKPPPNARGCQDRWAFCSKIGMMKIAKLRTTLEKQGLKSTGKKGALRQRLIEEGRHKSSMETQTPHLIPKPSEVFRWVAESFPSTASGEGGRGNGKLPDVGESGPPGKGRMFATLNAEDKKIWKASMEGLAQLQSKCGIDKITLLAEVGRELTLTNMPSNRCSECHAKWPKFGMPGGKFKPIWCALCEGARGGGEPLRQALRGLPRDAGVLRPAGGEEDALVLPVRPGARRRAQPHEQEVRDLQGEGVLLRAHLGQRAALVHDLRAAARGRGRPAQRQEVRGLPREDPLLRARG